MVQNHNLVNNANSLIVEMVSSKYFLIDNLTHFFPVIHNFKIKYKYFRKILCRSLNHIVCLKKKHCKITLKNHSRSRNIF